MTRFGGAVLLALAAAALVLGRSGSSWPARRGSGRLPAPAGSAAPARAGRLGRRRAGPAAASRAGWAVVRRLRTHARRHADVADLPLALDLLACALRAGQPPSTAAAAVAAAVGGRVGDALGAVARGAGLGAAPDIAWQPLARLTSAAAVARTAARTSESGTRLADELARMAADLRAGRAAAAEAQVRRAGVLVVLPLGLCFLPAFVLIGVVPIVIGIAGSVLR